MRRARRRRPSAFVPLLLLLLLLAVYGVVNKNLLDAYHGPQAVADASGALVFYDDGPSRDARSPERSFFLRKSADGRKWEKPQRVEGALAGAALRGTGQLVCLFPDFFSIYDRDQKLERIWSGATEGMSFQPRTVERLGEDVYAFGTDAQGTLLAARLEPDPRAQVKAWRFAPVEGARLPKAADPATAPGATEPEREGREEAPLPPAGWSGAQDKDGTLALLFRVQRRGDRAKARASGEPVPGELHLARFDGKAFTASVTLDEDLAAFATTAVTSSGAIAQVASSVAGALASPKAQDSPLLAGTAEVTTRVLVFGTRAKDQDPRVLCYVLEGSRLVEVESIPYKRGGFLREDQSVQALAAVSLQGRILLFAQIGGAVKRIVYEHGKWGEWEDFARLPAEATALVYGYMGSLLALALVMVSAAAVALYRRVRDGLPALRDRDMDGATADALVASALGRTLPTPVPVAGAPREAAAGAAASAESGEASTDRSEDDASIPDRIVAFLIDLGIVLSVAYLVRGWLDVDPVAYLNDDPVRTLAVLAWMTLGLIAYMAAFEVPFGWTPGKHLLGLEVRTLEGERAPALARLYRNLFRVELLFFATPLAIPVAADQHLLVPVPLVALVVWVLTPRNQRPGDLVAGTVVQRSRPARTADEDVEGDDARPAASTGAPTGQGNPGDDEES